MSRQRAAFTLVELLVVIGIIAVLIGILLPSLQAARRQAAATKCAAAMREVGNAFTYYALANRDYFPPMRTFGADYRLSLGNTDFTAQQIWYSFLAPYVTKTKVGVTATDPTLTADEAAQARRSVLWGCPAWDPPAVTTGALDGLSTQKTGYGMNAFPEYTSDYPKPAAPPNALGDFQFGPGLDPHAVATPYGVANWATMDVTANGALYGRWYKQRAWTHPAERALVADTRSIFVEAMAAPLDGTFPGQCLLSTGTNWALPALDDGQTQFDFYRHGKVPSVASDQRFSSAGGKVAFNVLFADGHVVTLVDRAEGYRVARMRYPG